MRHCLAVLATAAVLFGSSPGSAAEDAAGFIGLRYVTVVVPDYDAALAWYTNTLGFVKTEDRSFGAGRRWIVVAPTADSPVGIVLDLSQTDAGRDLADHVGKETDWVFRVRDCDSMYAALKARGVRFIEPPRHQPWGTTQAILVDPYGNRFVLESVAARSAAPR